MVNKIKQPDGCIRISENVYLQGKVFRVATGSYLRYQGTPNDNIAFSPFERQAFHKDPDKLYIF